MSGDRTLSYVDSGEDRERGFVAPYLVVVFDAERPLALPLRVSIAEVDEVALGRAAERRVARRSEGGRAILELGLGDPWLSTAHARLGRGAGGWELRDAGSKNGCHLGGRRVDHALLADGDLLELGSSFVLFRDRVVRQLGEPADLELAGAVGPAAALRTLALPLAREYARLGRIAPSKVPVVLAGESGTGKEVAARAIHDLSGRGPFVAVNCGALPDNLIEAELFGYRKGAFSGATEDRPGLVRAAHGGTLFLDEIAELPAAAQVKLLRVLQESQVVPLGATAPVAVDLRVVAASHRALPAEVAAGRFRADLLARLAGCTLALPPLRERREDLGLLIATLLPRVAGGAAITFEREASRLLLHHAWPLNVRELEQALRAACALAEDGRIAARHLPAAVRDAAASPAGPPPTGDADRALRAELTRALREHQGNISAVARDLGKARVQIRRWCRRLGLDPDTFRAG